MQYTVRRISSHNLVATKIYSRKVIAVAGGWNNNPNVMQFKSSFRRFVSRCGGQASGGKTGNVTSQMSVQMVEADSSTYIPPDASLSLSSTSSEQLFVDTLIDPEQHLKHLSNALSPLVGNILVYIGGWVVRKLLAKVSCDEYRSALTTQEPCKNSDYFIFLQLKNNGGLLLPSNGIICTISAAEKALRSLKSPSLLKVQMAVLNSSGQQDVFDLQSHMLETAEGISNHYFSLLRLTLEIFL
jgi:hypothetical protein